MNTFKRLLVLFVAGFCILGFNAGLARAATVDVAIGDDGLHPNTSVNIHKGDTVRWTNTGTVVHGVTSGFREGPHSSGPDGFIDSGPIAPGAAFEQIFTFHGSFGIYDKYNAAAHSSSDGGVTVDDEVFISPESSTFSSFQGFDLAFHFRNGLQSLAQCSIAFDGADLGNCSDILADPSFWQPMGPGSNVYVLTVYPHALPAGKHSLSIQGIDSNGQAFSDTAWYRVTDFGMVCGAQGC